MWFALALIFVIPCLVLYVAFKAVLFLVWMLLEFGCWVAERMGWL